MVNGSEQKAYWLKQLADTPTIPKLPLSKDRPPVCSFLRESLSATIPAEVWHDIQDLADRLGTTPQVVLLAALTTLLYRYTGQTDLIIGTLVPINAGQCVPPAHSDELPDRGSGARAAESYAQHLVPLRTRLSGQSIVEEFIRQVAEALSQASRHSIPFSKLLPLPMGNGSGTHYQPLFNVACIFHTGCGQPHSIHSAATEELIDCELVLHVAQLEDGLSLSCEFDAELLPDTAVQRFADHLGNLLSAMAAQPHSKLDQLNLLSPAERRQLLVDWNATQTKLPTATSIQQLIEARARETPGVVAVICRERQLTYGELNARANQVASYLVRLGVRKEVIVGLCVERSLEMLVGLLGILKAGGAYLPLDPAYPAERLSFMIQDAQVQVVLTQEHLVPSLIGCSARRVCLDADWRSIASEPAHDVDREVGPENLAYVIYTSGSTGKPKGVMVEHGSVLNFFAGMDERIPHGSGSTWLAVTSPSFDISVLELFWTLARGLKVVLYAGDEAGSYSSAQLRPLARQAMQFSLFYFSSDQTDGPGGPYRLLTEGAQFADEHGFVAVWTPERHFHEFGALFPNPSVTSAALAMITKRVQIRSGSVVAPLHSPIRIAEEWSVVDNLSQGRVAISFASGWMPEDFTVSPGTYQNRKEIMFQYIDVVRRLWRGERVGMPGALGKEVEIRIFPRPVQKELPLWLTAAGNPETFQMAGKLGMNLLTHLLGQSIEEVSRKVALYRQAWKEAGHPGRGHVTLMLHSFVGESLEYVKATVRGPLIEYLRKSADLIKGYAWAFSAFKHGAKSVEEIDFRALPKEEMDALLEHSFNRYFETSGLFGTPKSCVQTVNNLRAQDIDEIACLIDFGVDPEVVLDNLKYLDELRAGEAASWPDPAVGQDKPADYSIPALIERHSVTHLQCTPSMASMLLLDERTRADLGRLQTILLGGEPLPATLARELQQIFKGKLINMYGPTETTIWSSTYEVGHEPDHIPIGRPIANTQFYIVDQNFLPVPIGVVGELLIGGAGVARGYLGRPDLTRQRFISTPFDDERGKRLYRTGDLARYLPDGNLELLGRTDHQVKIRGHRVELGEIEALLNEHAAVRESVVVLKDTANGDKRLVAYVIARDGHEPTQNQLQQYAQSKMPEYMVPARVVFMSRFPQTANKKIDRNALPMPVEETQEVDTDFQPPATELEKDLAALWVELLEVERVGRQDDFFAAGGHSLLAMQLVARIRKRFRVDLPLRNLFEQPTIAGLAEIIEALAWSATPRAAIEPLGRREVLEV